VQSGSLSGVGKIRGGQNNNSLDLPPLRRAAALVATGLQKDLLINHLHQKPGPPTSATPNNIQSNRKAFVYPPSFSSSQATQPQAKQNYRPPQAHQNTRKALLTENQQPTQRFSNLSNRLKQPAHQLPISSKSSIDAAIIRGLSDVKINRASPPQSDASNFSKNVDSKVPGFPNLHRGTAPADGDCLFHSLIQLAGPSVAKAMGVPVETLNPNSVRKHVAAQLVSDFQLFNLRVINSEHLKVLTAFGDIPDENGEGAELPSFSKQDLVSLLGSEQRVKEFEVLDANQKAHVIRVATPQQFGGVTADAMPKLIADAFSDLKVVVHRRDVSADVTEQHNTFSGQSAQPQHTVRLFLEDKHYEPVFEGPPR